MVSCNSNQRERERGERESRLETLNGRTRGNCFAKEADPLVYFTGSNPNTKKHTTAVCRVDIMTLG